MWQVEVPIILAIPAAPRLADAVAALQINLQDLVQKSTKGAAAGIAGRDVVLLIAEHWLRWLHLPWRAEFADQKELQASARRALADAWSIHANDTPLTVAVDDAPWGRARAVVAIEQDFVEMLTATLREAGARKISVRPLASALTIGTTNTNTAFFVIDDTSLSVAIVREGRLQAVFTQPAGADPVTERQQLWHRIALRESFAEGLAPPTRVFGFAEAMTTTAAASPQDAPVFSDLSPRLRGPAAGLAAAGLAALLFAGIFAWQTAHSVAASEAVLKERTAPAPVAVPLDPAQQAQVRAVNRAIRQLNVPVTALLRAVPPRNMPGVSLLGIDIAGSYGATGPAIVKIEAEARTPTDMTNYVAQLAAHPALSGAWLTHHEVERERVGRPYRFSVETSWQK